MNWIKTHIKLVFLVIVIIFLVTIIVISSYYPGQISFPGQVLQTVVSYAEEPLTDASSGLRSGISGIFSFRRLQRENYELRKENEELKEQLTQAQLSQQKLDQLNELAQSLNYAAYDDAYAKVTADVIATDSSDIFNVFTVNAGKDEGVGAGDIVINEDGLVGKIITVGGNWSKVMSIVDASDSVSFTLLRDTDVVGVLSGDGEGELSGYLFDEQKSLNKGDILITSGMGLYPSGITIGTVTSVKFDEGTQEKQIVVKSAVNFRAIHTVTVLCGADRS